jgi:hypothetical protein
MTALPAPLSTEGLQGVDESLGISKSGSSGRVCRAQKNFDAPVLEKLWGTGISKSSVMLSR